MFERKTLLITGGTGSFGEAVLRRFLDTDIGEIRVFSRDEKKQDDMRNRYKNSKLKFFIGDVRNYNSISQAMVGVDYVFHAAALKQVPSCEYFPLEAVDTNVIGTENVLNAAINKQVKNVICLSTDKAVYPINAMGISKALMEKIVVAKNRIASSSNTVISVTRYGNVMCSRGSVIPLFINQIKSGQLITITDPNMTRFMMSLDDAVNLVLFAFENAKGGEIFIQKAPACTIEILAQAVGELFDYSGQPQIIGTRHGEKLYESLLTREEMARAADLGDYYMIPPDDRDLNYNQYFTAGKTEFSLADDYTSHNTIRLSKPEMMDMLLGLDYVKHAIKGELNEEGY
ncbi:putative nucleoside-diphosphate sugar epimerase [Desulfitobacterium dehalogenans ATCC 51507]|uniref:UDP-glucose 4-epimerase n=1 Tax=Desulfitobacterium dehalogenans (strain ATCC 51507 / DSM 9161 / JW/IU-DC1) TaxID=756499 RepID=I4ADR7_DESDJ|nr:polysaccharide biosynthesis protein [Desulfitobacterium dehalogenans]AFM02102.1 putative nucleoside-diphosphate sugar epimerase [Desulfitobacterium dehalogenans ATCC 51507]